MNFPCEFIQEQCPSSVVCSGDVATLLPQPPPYIFKTDLYWFVLLDTTNKIIMQLK